MKAQHRAGRRILFYMGHPAHFHNVKIVAQRLATSGHQILYVAREKDVLFQLLQDCPYPVCYLGARTGRGTMAMVMHVIGRELRMLSCAMAFRPDVLVGTDIVITHVARLLGRPSLILNEDDAAEVPLLAKYAFPYATALLAPHCCDLSPHNRKKIGYHGYHELAYLHPDHFQPDHERVAHLKRNGERLFLLRFSALTAHHDVGRRGIDAELAAQLVTILQPHGAVYITSERPLEAQLEPYRVPIHPVDMHHALALADLYIGDSQTMAAEAAVLGTPSVRFNDFVGRLSYLDELEREYGLTVGIPASQPDVLLAKVRELVARPQLKAEWHGRRQQLLSQTINVADFFIERILEFCEAQRPPHSRLAAPA